MNKRGHLMVTDRLCTALSGRHRFCLRLGSIMPDILVHTYIIGHTWNTSYTHLSRKMHWLERFGRMNCLSFLTLGYIIHYIEDYFTYPHNTWYEGSIANHVQYEHDFSEYIESKEYSISSAPHLAVMSADRLLNMLCDEHNRYQQEPSGFASDLTFIADNAGRVLYNYILIFENNNQEAFYANSLFYRYILSGNQRSCQYAVKTSSIPESSEDISPVFRS